MAVRPVVLAGFALAGPTLSHRVLVLAALYVAAASVIGAYAPRQRSMRRTVLGALLLCDLAWLAAAAHEFGIPALFTPILLGYAAGVVVALVSWTVGLEMSMTATVVYYVGALVIASILREEAADEVAAYLVAALLIAGGLVGYVVGEVRLLDRTRLAHARLRELNRAADELVAADRESLIFDVAASFAARTIDASCACVLRIDEEASLLQIDASAGTLAPRARAATASSGAGICGRVIATGEGVIVRSAGKADARLSPLEREITQGNLVAVPIMGESGVVAVLVATRPELRPEFTSQDLEALLMLAMTVGNRLAIARSLRDLRIAATRDPLTGLYNHETLLSRLEEGVRACGLRDDPLSLIVFDMDGFARINEAAGHQTGNRVLQSLARKLQQCCRITDAVGRCGGDEFAVVMPGATEQDARRVAERAGAALAAVQEEIRLPTPTAPSWGIACFPADASNDVALYRKAESRLHSAKRTGACKIRPPDPEPEADHDDPRPPGSRRAKEAAAEPKSAAVAVVAEALRTGDERDPRDLGLA